MSLKCQRDFIDKIWQVLQEIEGKSILTPEEEYIEIPLIHKNILNPKEKLTILRKLKNEEKAIELIPANMGEEFHKVRKTEKFQEIFEKWKEKNLIAVTESKERRRVENLKEGDIAYSIDYVRDVIRINGYYLSQPQENKQTKLFFETLWNLEKGEELNYDEFKKKNPEITQTLSKLRNGLGFKKPLNKVFFTDRKEFDYVEYQNFLFTTFHKRITKRYLQELGFDFLNLALFCDLRNKIS